MSVIQTLGPPAYAGFLEAVGEGADARTHKALIRFHGAPSVADCYVKAYCAAAAPKGLVNELIGYALAKWGGFDVPGRAAVILLDPEQATAFGSGFMPMLTQSGHVVAWCVESLGHPTPKQVFRLSDQDRSGAPSLQADLQRWSDLADAVAFDSWVQNDDRNPGNLVRLAKGRYALIDHGHVCSGNAWQSPLDRTRVAPNVLAHWAWNSPWVKDAPEEQHLPLVSSFDRHADALDKASDDLDYWLSVLVPLEEKHDAEQFLAERLRTVREYLRQTFGLLPL